VNDIKVDTEACKQINNQSKTSYATVASKKTANAKIQTTS